MLARFPGMASRAVGMLTASFSPLLASLFSVFLYWPRERSRGFPLVLCGFRVDGLWLVTAWMGRPRAERPKKTAFRRFLAPDARRDGLNPKQRLAMAA